VYLLDDPLSAVDVEVAGLIMANCIHGLLKDKAVLLVTHQVQHLANATEILAFKNGCVETRGLFHNLIDPSSFYKDVVDDLEIETVQLGTMPKKEGYGTFAAISKLNEAEQVTTGGVKMALHWKYWMAAGVSGAVSQLFLLILVQGFSVAADYWLRTW